MKHLFVLFFALVCLLLLGSLAVRDSQTIPALPPVMYSTPLYQVSDKEQIQWALDRFIQMLRELRYREILRKFPPELHAQSSKPVTNVFPPGFAIENVQIDIEGNSATVHCDITDRQDFRLEREEITLVKSNTQWRINDIRKLKGILKQFLSSSPGEGFDYDPPAPLTPATLRLSNRTLIKARQPWTDVYVINSTLTRERINRQLFARHTPMDLDGLLPVQDSTQYISFFLDPYWNRIVFAKRAGNWIKSYGDHTGEYQFMGPKSITTTPFDTIYVADTENGNIVKLYYNAANESIVFVGALTVPGIIHPVDIHSFWRQTQCSGDDLEIWIADDFNGKIVQINTAGVVQRTIESYTVQGRGTFRLNRPTKILRLLTFLATGEQLIAFIDQERNAFVTADISTLSGTTVEAYNFTEFSSPESRLSCIGQDYNWGIWVGDGGEHAAHGVVHGFTPEGKYLSSFMSTPDGEYQFVSPKSITKNVVGITPGCSRIFGTLVMFTADAWGPATGLRAYLPGADVVAMQVTDVGAHFRCEFVRTNVCRYRGKILRVSDSAVVYQFPDTVGWPGRVVQLVAKSSLPSYGNYKLRVEVLPYYNSIYGVYAQDWLLREVPFSHFQPLSASISGPRCRYNGQSGTWTANVVGGSGERVYQWYISFDQGNTYARLGTSQNQSCTMSDRNFILRCVVRDNVTNDSVTASVQVAYLSSPPPQITRFTQIPDSIRLCGWGSVRVETDVTSGLEYAWLPEFDTTEVRITISGSYVYIRHLCGGPSPRLDPQEPCSAPIVNLGCIVSDCAGRTAFGTWQVRFRCDTLSGGCPFVYTWNGESYVEDNNILPQSEDPENHGRDVTDFYHLFNRPVVTGDRYKLVIGEFERERTYLDYLRLMLIDHRPEMFVTVDDSGTVVQFAKPAAFLNAQLDSTQVLEQLSKLDNIKVEAAQNDTMRLWFTNDGSNYQQGLLLVAQIFTRNEKRPVAGIVKTGPDRNRTTFGTFRLRRNPSYAWVLVSAADTGTIQIEIEWKQSSAVDYSELSAEQHQPFTVRSADLLHAEHSMQGDVTEHLRVWDESYTGIQPGEWIELEFSAPPLAAGMERSFVLVSRGRYEPMELSPSSSPKSTPPAGQPSASVHSPIPATYDIGQNFPNPFNPATMIKYQLPEDGHVSLKVYDITGRLVATLVDETQRAGYYEVRFDATSLASGVYLYRMTAGRYGATKKLVVVK